MGNYNYCLFYIKKREEGQAFKGLKIKKAEKVKKIIYK